MIHFQFKRSDIPLFIIGVFHYTDGESGKRSGFNRRANLVVERSKELSSTKGLASAIPHMQGLRGGTDMLNRVQGIPRRNKVPLFERDRLDFCLCRKFEEMMNFIEKLCVARGRVHRCCMESVIARGGLKRKRKEKAKSMILNQRSSWSQRRTLNSCWKKILRGALSLNGFLNEKNATETTEAKRVTRMALRWKAGPNRWKRGSMAGAKRKARTPVILKGG